MSVLSQQEQEFEQDAMLEEDRRLRQLGHPQSHIYMFRSADLTYDTIAQLPLPWYATYAESFPTSIGAFCKTTVSPRPHSLPVSRSVARLSPLASKNFVPMRRKHRVASLATAWEALKI